MKNRIQYSTPQTGRYYMYLESVITGSVGGNTGYTGGNIIPGSGEDLIDDED